MVTNEDVRDLVYAGVGVVRGELGDRCQHLLRCYGGVGGTEIYNEGENSEQKVAGHNWGEGGRSEGKHFRRLLKCLRGAVVPIRPIGTETAGICHGLYTMRALCLLGNVRGGQAFQGRCPVGPRSVGHAR